VLLVVHRIVIEGAVILRGRTPVVPFLMSRVPVRDLEFVVHLPLTVFVMWSLAAPLPLVVIVVFAESVVVELMRSAVVFVERPVPAVIVVFLAPVAIVMLVEGVVVEVMGPVVVRPVMTMIVMPRPMVVVAIVALALLMIILPRPTVVVVVPMVVVGVAILVVRAGATRRS
jgi:hypothetical protein